MEQLPNLKGIETRPQRHWNADGLPELMMGILWAIWGVVILVPDLLPKNSLLNTFKPAVFVLLMFGGFASNWLTRKLKMRYSIPRTGYVKIAQPRGAAFIGAIVVGIVITMIIVGLASFRPGHGDLAAPGGALLLAAGFVVGAVRYDMIHFYWLAGSAVILGVAVSAARLNLTEGLAAVLFGVGIVCAVIGAFRFRGFLRDNPPQTATQL